jgi:REP element-mobilizing transposase RayT
MRKPRELKDGARYHVTARANRKEFIFDEREIKELFLLVVHRAKGRFSFRMENFCVMGNHFHFIIQPGRGESLSAIMQWILSVFAMAYNRLKNLTGHVWGNRFYSHIIASVCEYIKIFEYIDMNPVKAQRVADPSLWRYGGLAHHQAGCRDILTELPGWLVPLFPNHRIALLPES